MDGPDDEQCGTRTRAGPRDRLCAPEKADDVPGNGSHIRQGGEGGDQVDGHVEGMVQPFCVDDQDVSGRSRLQTGRGADSSVMA
jgi:hypothetical protein